VAGCWALEIRNSLCFLQLPDRCMCRIIATSTGRTVTHSADKETIHRIPLSPAITLTESSLTPNYILGVFSRCLPPPLSIYPARSLRRDVLSRATHCRRSSEFTLPQLPSIVMRQGCKRHLQLLGRHVGPHSCVGRSVATMICTGGLYRLLLCGDELPHPYDKFSQCII